VRSLAKLPVVDVDRELVLAAIALSRSAQQSAVGCGDRRRGAAGRVRALYSEDLNAGQVFEGVTVVDPFAASLRTWGHQARNRGA